MPSYEKYLKNCAIKYNLKIIEVSSSANGDITVKFQLNDEQIKILDQYSKTEYQRFKARAEMFAHGVARISYPKLNKCQKSNDILIVTGATIAITAFLAYLFDPSTKEE